MAAPPPPAADEVAKMPVQATAAPPPPPPADEVAKLKVGEAYSGGPEVPAPGLGAAISDIGATLKSTYRAGETALATALPTIIAGKNGAQQAGEAARAIGATAEGIAAPVAGAVVGAAKTALHGGNLVENIAEADRRIQDKLPDLTTGHPEAQALSELGAAPAMVPMQVVGDVAYDMTGSPLAGYLGQVAGGAAAPLREAVKGKPAAPPPPSAAVGSTVSAAAKTLGGSDELATVLGQHAAAHAEAQGVAPHAGVHSDHAVDQVADKDLQALSPKYKWLRDRGTSETEAKGALKAALQDKITNLTPETSTVDQAFGGETAPPAEGWGADIRPPIPNAGFPEDALIEKIQRHKAETSNPAVRKDLDKKIGDLTTAREWRRLAAVARSEGDTATSLDYLKRAEKINPTAETVSLDSGEAAPKPGRGGPLVERRGMAPAEPPLEGEVVEPPPAARAALPAPAKVLPPPAAVPVTSEGQAVTPTAAEEAQATGLTPDVQRAAAAHPGAAEPPVPAPPNTDVSTAVGMAGGMARGGTRTLISRMIPQFLDVQDRDGNTVRVNVWNEIHAHENAEFPNIAAHGYLNAHDRYGNAATARYLDQYNVDPRAYQNALRPHLRAAELDALQHPEAVDPTLDHRPYAPQAEAAGKAPKGDDTHMLGENHPYNRARTAPELVQRRATRTAARIAELEKENAPDQHAAERPADGNVPGGDQLRPGEETPAEAGNRNAAAEAPVGDINATRNRAEVSPGQHARTEAGAAPQEDGGQVRREEGAPDRRGDRNAGQAPEVQAGHPDEVTANADQGSVREGGGVDTQRPGSEAAQPGAAAGDGQGEQPPGAAPRREGTGGEGGGAPPEIEFQRGDAVRHGMLKKTVEGIADFVTAKWANRPRMVVHDSMDADTVPQAVKAEHARQQAGGAKGTPTGWYHNGEIHLNASAMRDTRHVLENLFHEGLGHYGLRGVFGKDLSLALDEAARARPAEIAAKIKQYGYEGGDTPLNRLRAADEVLASMAQERPILPPVRTAIAAIKNWLRKNIPALRGMKWSDDDLIHKFITPARRFVEEGNGRDTGTAPVLRRTAEGGSSSAVPRMDDSGAAERRGSADQPADDGPAFMRDNAPEPEPERQSKAREAAAAIGDAIHETTGRIFSGTQDIAQKLGQQGLRAALANAIRADTKARYMLKGVRDYADRLIGKDPALVRQATAAWEQGKPIQDPTLREFFAKAQKYGDSMVEQVRQTGKEMGYLTNYLPHLYKDPKRAAEVFYNYMQGRPLRTGGFTKQRFHETLEHARAAGLEPISENPVDLFLAHWSQMHKYVEMAKFKDHLDTHGLLRDEPPNKFRMPPGWAKINDPLFQGKIAPELVAKDINNHLAEGLYKYAGWRGFRAAENLLLRTRLTASLYHAGMTTVDSVLSHSSIGFQRALLGDYKGAAESLANAAGALPQAGADFFGKGAGSKLVQQFLGLKTVDPTTALIFDKLTRGGSRVFMEKTDTNDAITGFRRAMMQGKYTEAAGRSFGAGVEAMTYNIAQKLVPAQKMIARVALFKLELDRVATEHPELGAKRGDYAGIIDKLNPDFIDHLAAKVGDNVDDRLGQFAYDNLFMNRMVRDALAATVQSPGWNIGSGRLIFGGMKDIKQLFAPDKIGIPLDKAGKIADVTGPRLTSRLAYLLTMNAGIMAFNGLMTALLTGTPPTGKDFWYFRTGAKNADGSDERMNLPSYQRDEYGLLHQPLQMLQNKLHPALSMAFELWRNQDYFGNEIHNPQDHLPAQARQYLDYFLKGVEPYAVKNQQRNLAAGGGAVRAVAPFFGVTAAPASIARTKFQQAVVEARAQQEHETNRTPEQAQHGRDISDAINKVRAGDRSVLATLSEKDRQTVLKDARTDINEYRYAGLPLQQQVDLYDKATPAEAQQYKLLRHINERMLSVRGQHELKAMDPEDAQALRARVRELRQAAP
jgi:hypothetical protein